jgi:hypothetical protein
MTKGPLHTICSGMDRVSLLVGVVIVLIIFEHIFRTSLLQRLETKAGIDQTRKVFSIQKI